VLVILWPRWVRDAASRGGRPAGGAARVRGVWVATVANIDWPSSAGLPVAQQRAEMITLLDRARALKFNAIILQVRPAADAFLSVETRALVRIPQRHAGSRAGPAV